MSIRVASERPLMIVVGPRAIAATHGPHPDLELVDVIEVERAPTRRRLQSLCSFGMFARPHTICVFDDADEHLWDASAEVARLATRWSASPAWFVCADHRERGGRDAMLERLAIALGLCVIDPGPALLDAALAAAAALFRPGLVGTDRSALRACAPARSVLRSTDICGARAATAAVLVLRGNVETSLRDLNEIVSDAAAALAPGAPLFVAAPGSYARSTRTMLARIA